MNKPIDPEIAEFEEALLRSIDQARHGEGRVTTPEQIVARRHGRRLADAHRRGVARLA